MNKVKNMIKKTYRSNYRHKKGQSKYYEFIKELKEDNEMSEREIGVVF